MTTTTRKTWRKVGTVGAMTLLLGCATATGAHSFERLASLSDTGSLAGCSGIQIVGRNPANIINHGRIFCALGVPSAPTEETTAYLRPADRFTDQVEVDFSGGGLIRFMVGAAIVQRALVPDGPPLGSRVDNDRRIATDGEQVRLTAKAVGDVLPQAVNTGEITVARSLVTPHRGVARLIGGDSAYEVVTVPIGTVQKPIGTVQKMVGW